ncbi:MAG: hypothetical protein HXX08_05830 [Chloroflexi bacterium]|uniref:Alpha-L-arabinofuranosidase C-terminal domain-containing protein n=1 Tax=Candidatus Chlorohelix allophototropha TaxID=3003348 RepID=A0A8T7LYI4_9CHLR|nr:hypothetical protein [Chloroflexota bacterium]
MKKLIIPGVFGLGFVVIALGVGLILWKPASATLSFTDPAFEKTWNGLDKAVFEQAAAGRGYTWGPVVVGAESISGESYNGTVRKVAYFEKARMEINNPAGNKNDLFYVTTGLLVKELVTGLRQDGDETFTQLPPSTVQVAGDPNDGNANPNAPTYASFRNVVTIFGNQNGKPSSNSSIITASIDKAGNISSINPPETHSSSGYDDVTQHNIADVFVDYGKNTGKVWNGNSYLNSSIFYGNPTYVLGRPISEPFWISTQVAGSDRMVLVQLFERRVLTYTPSNPVGFKVEMGNVGQHYYKWRYTLNNSPIITPPATTVPTTTAAATPQPTRAVPAGKALNVNFGGDKNTFSNKMLGVNFVNWEHSWGKPYPSEVPGLVQALKAANVGLIRYAGGNWSNSVGWDRNQVRDPNIGWPDGKTGPYYFQYNPEEIDSVATLAKAVGADVMIEVNIFTSNPAMWADMVKYTNVEHNYGFKYWELGNELDAAKNGPTPDEYANDVSAYLDAMLAVDPSIQVIASGVASPYEATRQNYSDTITSLSEYLTKPFAVTSPKGAKIQAVSYHWYQACNSNDPADLTRYTWSNIADNSWRNTYSRKQADIFPPRITKELTKGTIPQGVTEYNFDACNFDNPMNGNFLNALWTADVLGRMNYNGVNFATRWEGYATQSYSIIYPDKVNGTTIINVSPAYYAYLMYANYFGDKIVESSSFDNANISIWASRDTSDPSKLKLMVTNLSGSDITAPINLAGFNASSGSVYQMKSANPTEITKASLDATATINDVSVDAMNVAGSLASIKPVPLAVSGSAFNYVFPAYTTTAIILTK